MTCITHLLQLCAVSDSYATADVEAEDMELGSKEQQDLAADVDTGLVAEDDLEALDTDDEETEEQSLGIDTEESEGTSESSENQMP